MTSSAERGAPDPSSSVVRVDPIPIRALIE
jgi:hypothetical protein